MGDSPILDARTSEILNECTDPLTFWFVDSEHARAIYERTESSIIEAKQNADTIAEGIAKRVEQRRSYFSLGFNSDATLEKTPDEDDFEVQEIVAECTEAIMHMDPVTRKEHFLRLKQKQSMEERSKQEAVIAATPLITEYLLLGLVSLASSKIGGEKVGREATSRLIASTAQTATSDLRKMMQEDTKRDKDQFKKLVDSLRKASASAISELSPEVQGMITIVDADIDSKLRYSLDGNDILQLNNMIRRRELVYTLMKPTSVDISEASTTLSPEEKASMATGIDEILNDYPEHRDSLSNIISRIRSNSSAAHPRKIMVYLAGPAGVGKTSFVERTAVALRQHYCKILAKDFTEEVLYGYGQGYDSRYDAENEALLGVIGDAFRRADGWGIILNIDELGDIFDKDGRIGDGSKLSLLKKLLDPKTTTITLPGIRVPLDISRVTIFATGNYYLKDKALLDRVTQVIFGGLGPAQKATVLYSTYRQALNEFRSSMPFERFLQLKQFSDKLVPVMFTEAERFPGVRLIETEVPSVLNRIFGNETCLDYETLVNFIIQSFARHVVKDDESPESVQSEDFTLDALCPEAPLLQTQDSSSAFKLHLELIKSFEIAFSESAKLAQLESKLSERLALVDQMLSKSCQNQAEVQKVAFQKFNQKVESFLEMVQKMLAVFAVTILFVVVIFEVRNTVVHRYYNTGSGWILNDSTAT